MKIFEMITPEMVTIATVALAALTLLLFLIVLISIASLSRVKKRLLAIGEKCVELEEKHTSLRQNSQMMSTHMNSLSEAADKIVSLESHLDSLDSQIASVGNVAEKLTSIEHQLDGLDQRIAQSHNQLKEHESKLNELDTFIGQTGQLIGKNAAGFSQAIQRFHTLEQEFQGLKAFQRSFEQIRHRILNALGATPVERPSQQTSNTEQKGLKEENVIPSEPKVPHTEDLYKSRMPYRYP